MGKKKSKTGPKKKGKTLKDLAEAAYDAGMRLEIGVEPKAASPENSGMSQDAVGYAWMKVLPEKSGYLANAKKGPVLAVSLYANASCDANSEVLQFPVECAWRCTLIAGEMMLEIVEKADTDQERVVAQIKNSLVRYVASPQYFFRDSSYKIK